MMILNIIYILLIMPLTIYSGYAVQTLWHWFIVPLGMSELVLAHALGITLCASYLTHHLDMKRFTDKKTEDEEVAEKVHQLVFWIIKPSFALAFGWLYHYFM